MSEFDLSGADAIFQRYRRTRFTDLINRQEEEEKTGLLSGIGSTLADGGNILWSGVKDSGASVLTGVEQAIGGQWNVDDDLRASAEETYNKVSPELRDKIAKAGFQEESENTFGGVAGAALKSAGSMAGYLPAAALGPIGGTLYAAGLTGAMIGGDNYAQTYQAIKQADDKALEQSPLFGAYYREAAKEENDLDKAWISAKEKMAGDLAGRAHSEGFLTGLVSGGLLGPSLEKMFEGGQGFVQGLKHGAKTEGLQETSESGSQAYSTEKALAEAENRGIRYGRVARDTAFGTTLGTGMGGAVGGTIGAVTPRKDIGDRVNEARNRAKDEGGDSLDQAVAAAKATAEAATETKQAADFAQAQSAIDALSPFDFYPKSQEGELPQLVGWPSPGGGSVPGRGQDLSAPQYQDDVPIEGEYLGKQDRLNQDRLRLDRPVIEGELDNLGLPRPALQQSRRDALPSPALALEQSEQPLSRLQQRRMERQRAKQEDIADGEVIALPDASPLRTRIEDRRRYKQEHSSIPVSKSVALNEDEAGESKVSTRKIIRVPLNELTLSDDVPQFKSGANADGVVDRLKGSYDETGMGPIQVWVRKDGSKEVITGRHRFDLAKRSGVQDIPAQLHYESDGFTAERAKGLDAELNIKDNQGQVKDYVQFLQSAKLTREEATRAGFLDKPLGQRAFEIADVGSPSLIAAHRNGQITSQAAYKIALTAPKDEAYQAIGIKAVQEGKSQEVAVNMMKAAQTLKNSKPEMSQDGDLFGFDDTAMKLAEEMARVASRKQNEIRERIRAVEGAAKRPEIARKEGVNVKDPQGITKRITELKQQAERYDNWHQHSDILQEIRSEVSPEQDASPDFDLEVQTEESLAQQEARSKQADQAEQNEKVRQSQMFDADQQIDGFTLTGSDRHADVAMAHGQRDIFSEPESSTSQAIAAVTAQDAAKTEDEHQAPVKEALQLAVGDTVTPNMDIDYLSKGQTYTVERVDSKAVHFKSDKGHTSVSKAVLNGAAQNKGLELVKGAKTQELVAVNKHGVTLSVPHIDKELMDSYNRTTHMGKGRDFNEELKSMAENILDNLANKKHTLVTDEQKAEAQRRVNQYLEEYADHMRKEASEARNNPSWFITGRANLNIDKYNKKAEANAHRSHERFMELEKRLKRIESDLYEMRPQETKTRQETNKHLKEAAFAAMAIAEYMRDGRKSLEKEARTWASPKARKQLEQAYAISPAATVDFIKKLDGQLNDVGGLAEALGPRSGAGKYVKEILANAEATASTALHEELRQLQKQELDNTKRRQVEQEKYESYSDDMDAIKARRHEIVEQIKSNNPEESGKGSEADKGSQNDDQEASPRLTIDDLTEKAIIVRGDTMQIKDKLKAAKGWWNRKEQGWMFPKTRREEIERLIADLPPIEPDAKPQQEKAASVQVSNAENRQTNEAEKKAKRLEVAADRLDKMADKALNQNRLTNTAKRAREAGSAIESAHRQQRDAQEMRAIAEAIRNDPDHPLGNVQSHKDLQALQSLVSVYNLRDFPQQYTHTVGAGYKVINSDVSNATISQHAKPMRASIHSTHWKDIVASMKGVRGYAQLAKKYAYSSPVDTRYLESLDEDEIAKINAFAKERTDYASRAFSEAVTKHNRYIRLGLGMNGNPAGVARAYLDLTRGMKTERKASAADEQLKYSALKGKYKDLDFFNTTKGPAAEVVRLANLEPDMKVLEPSAGIGHLADAAAEVVGKENVTTNEYAQELNSFLKEKGYSGTNEDFLSIEPEEKYDRVIMNPPFSKDQEITHIEHAFKFLKPGGRLVAITSSMAGERSNKRNQDFKEWLDDIGAEQHPLPDGSFKDAINSTMVNSKIIVIDKPQTTGTALFSLNSDKDLSPFSPGSRYGIKGLSEAITLKAADSFLGKFHGANDVEIIIKRTAVEAFGPEAVRKDSKLATAKGAYDPERNRLILISSNLRNLRDLRETLQHEILAHKGLGLFKESDVSRLLKAIVQAKEHDKKLAKIWAEVERNYSDKSITVQAEEVLGRVAEQRLSMIDKAWIRALSFFRRMFREKGWVKADITYAELRETIYKVGDALREGRKPHRRTVSENFYSMDNYGPRHSYYYDELKKYPKISSLMKQRDQLEIEVDEAYETGNFDLAEDLDAQLAEINDDLDNAISEVDESDASTYGQFEQVDAEPALDDNLIALHKEYISGESNLDESEYIDNVRGIVSEFGGDTSRLSDKKVFAAVKDLYQSRLDRLERVKAKKADEAAGKLRFKIQEQSEPISRPVSRLAATAAIKRITRKWKSDGDLQLVDSVKDLPGDMQNTLAILGVKADKPKGIFDQETGTIYLIRNNLNSVEALERTVFHEALGHKGLRLAFGKDFKNIMLDLFDLMGQKEFDRLAEKYGLSLPEYDAIHQIREYYAQRQMPHEKVILFMDELLANMAEVNKPSIQQKLKEFWGRFRVWLYDHGFIKLNNLGESELLAILRDARKAIKNSTGSYKNEADLLFSLSNNEFDAYLEAMWRDIGSRDEMYRYPVPESKDIKKVFSEIDASLTVQPVVPDGHEKGTLGVERKWEITTSDGKLAYLLERDNEVWIDVSLLKSGRSQGSAIYAGAMGYAYNNGKKFVGDPDGLSNDALMRRTEMMLSSALKYGSTDHLEPHIRQEMPDEGLENWVKPIDWKEGSYSHNLRQLLAASYGNVIHYHPEIKNVIYNFKSGEFQVRDKSSDTDGKSGRMARLLNRGNTGGRQVLVRGDIFGSTALKRAALTNTILSKKTRAERGLLLSESSEHLSTGKADKLDDLLYSLNSDVEKNNPDSLRFSFSDSVNAANLDKVLGKKSNALVDAVKDALLSNKFVTAFKEQWLGALTLRQLGDVGKKYLPQIKDYVDVVHKMLTDRNVKAEKAADFVEELQKWAKKNQKEADTMFNLMHDATLAGVDPSEKYVSLEENIKKRIALLTSKHTVNPGDGTAKLVKEKAELEKKLKREPERRQKYLAMSPRFAHLSPEAKALFKKARDEYRQTGREFLAVLEGKIERASMDGKIKKRLLAELRLEHESQELEVYFPLARFGNYYIDAVDPHGERVYLMMESEHEQQRTVKNMEKAGFKVEKSGRTINRRFDDGANLSFVNELVENIEGIRMNDKNSGEVKDAIYQAYLQHLPDRSIRKQYIHRKGVAGFSQDAIRAFADKQMKSAYQLARLKHSDDLTMIMEDMKRSAGSGGNKSAIFYNEMSKRHDWVMNPTSSVLSQKITGMGFVWMLGVSPAAAAVNLTQTPVIAGPVLGARYGMGKSFKEMVKASRLFNAKSGSMLEKLTDKEERAAFHQWHEMGLLDATRAHDLAGVAEQGGYNYSSTEHKIMNGISFLFHRAEQFNREVTAIAAYRLARSSGKNFNEAVKEAAELTWDSHFDYCVDTETECLTKAGWKKYNELNVGDVALAVDQTGRCVESKILEVATFSGNKEVIEFRSKTTRFNMTVTPNHRCLVRRYDSKPGKWTAPMIVRAASLKNHHHIMRAPLLPLNGRKSIYGEDYAALLGWVAAEGWYGKFRNCKKRSSVWLAQSNSHNPEYVKEIRSTLDRLGGEYNEQYLEDRDQFYWLPNGNLRKRIIQDMPDKILTKAMLEEMTQEEMVALIDAFCKGDGSNRGNGAWTIAQKNHCKNTENLEILQAMATVCGITSTINYEDNNRAVLLLASASPTGKGTHVKPLARETKYIETVWCPKTEHETWIARKNGAVFVTGNTNVNRARFMQSDFMKVATQFKQYSQNMTYYLLRNLNQSFKGATKQERQIARRQITGTLALTGLIGGINALPLWGLYAIANAVFGDDDEPFDAKTETFAYLADLLGKDVADWFIYGAGGAGVSPRISLDGLWLRDSNKELEGEDAWSFYAQQAVGPVLGGIAPSMFEGMRKISQGEYQRGFENMVPKFVKDLSRAERYFDEGATTLKGDALKERDDFSAMDLMFQAIGLADSDVSAQYAENAAIKGYEQHILDRRKRLLNRYYMAWKDGDSAEKTAILKEIKAFNERWPKIRLSPKTLRQSMKVRERYRKRAEHGVILNKKLEADLERLDWAG